MLKRLKRLWEISKEAEHEQETVVAMNFDPEDEEPFLTFPCPKCKEQITLEHTLSPGQVAALKCENCGETWAIYLPPVEIKPVKEMEELWPLLSEDPFEEEEPVNELAEISATP